MMGMDARMEQMIDQYFRYAAKDALSVDEFLKFRRQAAKEAKMGIGNAAGKERTPDAQPISRMNPGNGGKEHRKHPQSGSGSEGILKSAKKEEKPIQEEARQQEVADFESEFLAIMRAVED